jgi:hypothetical protein
VLLLGLLQIAIIKNNTRGVHHLCNVPCASSFGESGCCAVLCVLCVLLGVCVCLWHRTFLECSAGCVS